VTCEEADQSLMDYVSGDLPDSQRLRFKLHITRCAACRTYLQTYQMTVRLGRWALGDLDATCDEDLPPEIVSAILAAAAR
jgi:anti-sigma factor RsiW